MGRLLVDFLRSKVREDFWWSRGQSFRQNFVRFGDSGSSHRHHHHDLYCHTSLRAAVLAYCVNYTAALLCVNKQLWRIGELPLRQ